MSDITKDADKQEQLLKELEIESILAETHEMADREKMKRTAQKYRVKPKVPDIYSNADKKPRLTNANPLELDNDKPEEGNAIVGEKTATTIQAELIMDGREEQVPTPESSGQPAPGETEPETEETPAQQETAEAEDNINVTLTPEYAEETQFHTETIFPLKRLLHRIRDFVCRISRGGTAPV